MSSSLEIVKTIDSNIAYIEKPFWHVRQEDAIEHAENLRKRKILLLKKQLNKLKSIRFE